MQRSDTVQYFCRFEVRGSRVLTVRGRAKSVTHVLGVRGGPPPGAGRLDKFVSDPQVGWEPAPTLLEPTPTVEKLQTLHQYQGITSTSPLPAAAPSGSFRSRHIVTSTGILLAAGFRPKAEAAG